MDSPEGPTGDGRKVERQPFERIAALREAMRDVVVSSAKVYDRMLMNVHLTRRGIEIDSRVTLVD